LTSGEYSAVDYKALLEGIHGRLVEQSSACRILFAALDISLGARMTVRRALLGSFLALLSMVAATIVYLWALIPFLIQK
jgi:hypothetical protein